MRSASTTRGIRALTVTSLGLVLGSTLLAPGIASAVPAHDRMWSVADGDVVFTVPAGVCAIAWDVRGGAGGAGDDGDGTPYAGGRGGSVTATASVSAGNTFFIQAGGSGQGTGGGTRLGGSSGAQASGGNSSSSGAGGGGASIVRAGGSLTGAPVIVAGGGGGGGYNGNSGAGGNAGPSGADGVNASTTWSSDITRGVGGTPSVAGAGGTASLGNSPTAGGGATGMVGGTAAPAAGGGGGGSKGGGGGASARFNSNSTQTGAGGGGGANFADAGAVTVTANATAGSGGAGYVYADFTACAAVAPVPVLDAATSTRIGEVDLSFHDGADTGIAVDGYEYSVDGGTTWHALTVTGTAPARRATVGGLTPGASRTFVVRATAADGNSAASSSRTVVVASAPGTPRTVTATADNAQVAVSWLAPSSGAPVDHYVVTLAPGGRTCTTSGTTCLFGAEAGTAYTATVVGVSAAGVQGPGESGASAGVAAPVVPQQVPADALLTLTTDKGLITKADVGEEITVIGTGFLPYSTATIIIYSTPTVLGTVVTDGSGNFSRRVTVPTALAAGAHSLVASGVAPDGTDRFLRMNVTVAPRGRSAAGLAYTGFDPTTPVLGGLGALVAGAALLLAARRRRATD